MIGLFVFGSFALWIAIAIWVGFAVHKKTQKRWMQVATSLFVLWLPFWDVIPGYLAYRKSVDTTGGVRIYRIVAAEGYLSGWVDTCFDCWRGLKHSPFRYIEVERTKPNGLLQDIEPLPGYYDDRLVTSSSPDVVRVSAHFDYF